MRFTVYKHPKILFLSEAITFSLLFLCGSAAVLYGLLFVKDGVWLTVGIVCFLFSAPLCLALLFVKNDIFSEFTVHQDGITVHHPKKGEWTLLWHEIEESAVFEVHHQGEFFLTPKLICFSKKALTKKDKLRLHYTVKTDMLCVGYTEDIIFAVREYFPIPLEIQCISVPRHASKKDMEE